jgi:MerR family redox-sensitive transcriptional activator SoxR
MRHARCVEQLTIGAVATRSGVAVSALRYYEQLGLIASSRTAGGQRRYHQHVLRRIAVIQAGQRVGLPLSRIQQAFAGLPPDKAPTRAAWTRLSREWRASIQTRIAELERLRDDLDGCIGCGCLSLRRCALYNPGDQAATEGPGARLLRQTSNSENTRS